MVVMNSGSKMPGDRHCPRIDTLVLKHEIKRKVGRQKAEKYFNLLGRYLSLKISKSEFDKLCIGLIGRESIRLHNGLIRAIVKNVYTARTPPLPPQHGKSESSLNVKVPNGFQRSSSLQSLCRDVFPQSPRKGRTPTFRDRKFRDRPSPLGPHGKTHGVVCEDSAPKVQEQQSATELLSLGSRPPVEVNSVEDGEEVEQAAVSPGIYSSTPVTAPLGVSLPTKGTRKLLHLGLTGPICPSTCYSSRVLPDTTSLKKILEQKLEMEGMKPSIDCINLLNNGLDVYMRRLLKPCLELAAARSEHKQPNQGQYHAGSVVNGKRPVKYVEKANKSFSVSMLDFRVAMESNPRILGEDWPVHLERISLHGWEESNQF